MPPSAIAQGSILSLAWRLAWRFGLASFCGAILERAIPTIPTNRAKKKGVKIMAESIYTTLAAGSITIKDQTQSLTVQLPSWVPSDQCFESPSGLLEHFSAGPASATLLHSILQSGIKHEIISIRAAARPSGSTQSFEPNEVQSRVTAYLPSVTRRPSASSKRPLGVAGVGALLASGLAAGSITKQDIAALLKAALAGSGSEGSLAGSEAPSGAPEETDFAKTLKKGE